MPSLDWNTWLRSVGVPELEPAGALSFNQYDQIIQAAVQGQGVALGRSPLLKRLLKEGALVAPFSMRTVAPRGYYLMRSDASTEQAGVEAFVTWIVGEARSESSRRRSGDRLPATRELPGRP